MKVSSELQSHVTAVMLMFLSMTVCVCLCNCACQDKLFPQAVDYLQRVFSVRKRVGPVLLSR